MANCDYAIVFWIFNGPILTGSLINSFEYFLSIYEHNRDMKLIYVNGKEEHLKKFFQIMEDRYVLDGIEDYKKNVIALPRNDLLRTKFKKAFVLDYGTSWQARGLLRTKELIVISEKHTSIKGFVFSSNDYYKVTYYGEMPFEYRDVEYRMKMLFDRYQPLKNVQEGIFVNSPKNTDYSFLKDLNLPNKPIIFKNRDSHKTNLFELFDTFLYYHANMWFDPHPRLFPECKFYNKDIIYINNYGVLDGSYYRYTDVKENGVKGRVLNKDDEIVRQFIN